MLETYGLSEHNFTYTGSEQIIVDNENGIAWMPIIAGAYLLIASLFASKLFFSFIQVSRLVKRSHHHERSPGGYVMHYISSSILSFSFLQKIFLSENFELNPEEKRTVIAHEEFHIAQRHSLDVILAELIRVVCWFNPVIHLIQKHLKQIHEYQADVHVCKSHDKHLYAYLLQSHQWKKFNLPLGNSISGSSINKRIKMMKKSTQTPALLRSVITALSAIMLFFIISCEENLESPQLEEQGFKFEFTDEDLELEIERTLNRNKNAPNEILDLYKNLQVKNPSYKYGLHIIPVLEGQLDDLNEHTIEERWERARPIADMKVEYLRFLNRNEFDQIFAEKSVYDGMAQIVTAYAIITRVSRIEAAEYRYKMSSDYKIRNDYDKAAVFDGGEKAFESFVRENLKYPMIAKEQGIEDRIVMSLVVNKMGHYAYLNIEEMPKTKDEQISFELQKAAFHFMKKTEGKWLPAEKNGKYVASRLIVPIEFKLEE